AADWQILPRPPWSQQSSPRVTSQSLSWSHCFGQVSAQIPRSLCVLPVFWLLQPVPSSAAAATTQANLVDLIGLLTFFANRELPRPGSRTGTLTGGDADPSPRGLRAPL